MIGSVLHENGIENTPGTAGGPGSRDHKLAVKSRKNSRKSVFVHKKNKNIPPIFFFAYIFYTLRSSFNDFTSFKNNSKEIYPKSFKLY